MPGVHGFYGATSMERLPVERGISEQVRKFTEIKTATLKKNSLGALREHIRRAVWVENWLRACVSLRRTRNIKSEARKAASVS